MTGRVLVAGVGNIFHGDDGFGSEVARRLAAEPLSPEVRVVDYGIRGMHLAYELLDGYAALVIVDAAPRGGEPGEVHLLDVGPDDLGEGEFDAHGMNPVAVLGSLAALGGRLPRTFVVGCEPAELDERMGLSAPVAAAVGPTVTAIVELLERELGLSPPALAQVPATSGTHPSEG